MSPNPFAKLEALREKLPSVPGDPSAARGGTPAPTAPHVPRAVVRYERKGRGGKEATVVERLGLTPARLEVWCREIKKQLGCGGTVDGANLVFQGDQRERIAPILSARGVRNVSVSGP